MKALLLAALLLAPALAGCAGTPPPSQGPYQDLDGYERDPTGRNATKWPNLSNVTITLLDNGAFKFTFDEAAKQFKALTGITVKREDGVDTLDALNTLQRSNKNGRFDVIYGVDNMVLFQAVENGLLLEYKPALADRIDPNYVFFGNAPWFATPVDHGYVAVNYDSFHDELEDDIDSLLRLRRYADQLVVPDPRKSSPGLGFLLVTIDAFGEAPAYSPSHYDWKAYWRDLLRGTDTDRDGDQQPEGCVLVVPNWTVAYEQHFSAAGQWVGESLRDKPIVVSYTESPAYEAYAGMDPDRIASVLKADGTTYHQIQTMAIANGTKNLAAAQAWIEFTLTDFFQELAAPYSAVYPVVPSIDVSETYGGLDPTPGSFQAVRMSQATLAQKDAKGVPNLQRWLAEWADLYQDPELNCNL
jgi:thiamine transport system substrate-binding protein